MKYYKLKYISKQNPMDIRVVDLVASSLNEAMLEAEEVVSSKYEFQSVNVELVPELNEAVLSSLP